jgi:eukaryotic-like serine/threonine-protein kinase
MVSQGTILSGRYRLDQRIAGGGMGDVWQGTDEVLGRTVAVKIMLPSLMEEAGFVERFRAEARTMATINHSGVVRIYDFGNDDKVAYLIMEYIEGEALSRTLNRVGRLTPARTMSLIAQAADALHEAHEKGIVHRDVKPGNLLVRPNGTLVLTDFGIARSAAAAQLTVAGAVLGTASYLAPEQASGAVASAASDVYSLGVVAYQCLTGHRPYEGDTPLEIAMKHVNGTPRAMPSDIPVVVRQLVQRAMSKQPGARWTSAQDFAAAARRAAAALAKGVTSPTLPVEPEQKPGPTITTQRNPPAGPNGVGGRGGTTYNTGNAGVPGPKPVVATPYQPVYQPQPEGGGRTTLVVVLVVALMVLVLVCAAVAGYWARKNDTSSLPAGLENVTFLSADWSIPADPASMYQMTEGRRTP